MSISSLRSLERRKYGFGPEAAKAKKALLGQLRRARLPTPGAVQRLHEVLGFLRAYPDDQDVLAVVEDMLQGFARRADLRRHRRRLEDTGIAGTAIVFRFFAATAARLVEHWPDQLTVDWDEVEDPDRTDAILQLLALWGETPALDELPLSVPQWIARLKNNKETDAAFLIRRIRALHLDAFQFERFYENLGLMLRLEAGPGTPCRTLPKADTDRLHFQLGPMRTARPDLKQVLDLPPLRVRNLTPATARRYVEMARDAMVTRHRDLDAFAYGDARDVRLVDWEDGLQFAVIGVIPERRLMLEAVYAFLTLKNGVPIGYVLNSALFGSAEIAYNVFDTFRGGEAGHVYGRVLATVRHLFGTDSFTIYPYQLGQDNDEALQSGAWWFYQKLGFRARHRGAKAAMNKELARIRRNPRHRSSLATLARLSEHNVYYHMAGPRDDVIGLLCLGNVGLRVTDLLARRFGSDREAGERECTQQATKLLGLRERDLAPDQRLWFRRWAPLVAVLPGVSRWPVAARRQLLEVIVCKGSRRESDFARAFDGHRRLRQAVLRLGRPADGSRNGS